jgi:hypothetical protein
MVAGAGGITNLAVSGNGLSVAGTGNTRTLTLDLTSRTTGAQVTAPIATALLNLTSLSFKDGSNAAIALSIAQSTKLFWGGKEVLNVDHLVPYFTASQVNSNYATITALNQKQDTIVAGTNVTKVGATLSVHNLASLAFKYQTETPASLSIATGHRLLWNGVNMYNETEILSACANAVTIAGPYTASMNTAAGTKQFTYDPAYQYTQVVLKDGGGTARILAASQAGGLLWNTVQLATVSHFTPYSTTAQTAVLLAAKQATLSVGAGAFLSGTTLTGYGLRWNATNTPTGAIEEIHWDGYSVAQTVNFGTGKLELSVGHPTGMATQTWTNTQLASYTTTSSIATQLAAKQNAIVGSLNIPGSLTFATTALSSGWGLPLMGFVPGLTNYYAIGFTTTSLGSNNVNEALTISRTGTVSITGSLGNHSDKRLKKNIEPVDAQKCQALFDSVEAVTYQRTDLPDDSSRLGFLAQSFVSEDFPNLVGQHPGDGMLTLDYARCNCVLWTVVKTLQQRIEVLESAVPKRPRASRTNT